MALRNYITHPADNSLEVLHVENGAAKTTIENTTPIAVDPGTVDVTGAVTVTQAGTVTVAQAAPIVVDDTTPIDVVVTNPAGGAPTGAPFAARSANFVNVNNATAPILSLQHNGVGALGILLKSWEVYNDGRDVAFMDLIMGGTLTGASFAAVAGSEIEVDTSATAITGGTVIASMLVGRDTSRDIVGDILSSLNLDIATIGPLSVVATDEPGSRSVQVASTLNWLEL